MQGGSGKFPAIREGSAAIPGSWSQEARPGRLRAGLAYYRALLAGKDFFAKTVAPPWTFPVLAIDSQHTMNGLTAKSFERITRRTKSVIAADCGHFVQEEQPDSLLKTLLDFLPHVLSSSWVRLLADCRLGPFSTMTTHMRGAWYERTGSALEAPIAGELPDPVPGPDEVRVRIHGSAANPADTKQRSGWAGDSQMPPRIVPHCDGTGGTASWRQCR